MAERNGVDHIETHILLVKRSSHVQHLSNPLNFFERPTNGTHLDDLQAS